MTDSRIAFLSVALVCGWLFCRNADAQKGDVYSTNIEQPLLSLNVTNNGQHLAAALGQQIEITLGIVGPKEYGTPQVSSSAIRLESVELAGPQNPGGPTFIYFFEAIAEGEAQIKVPVIDPENPNSPNQLTFSVTLQVAGNAATLHASTTPDQANTAPWKNAWTNLLNDAQQTFTPSLPRLTRVEVELVVANPGPSDENVVMSLQDAAGELLAVVSKTVPAADCSRVMFFFPNGGLRVLPGQVYSLRLRGGSLFGWKYVVGGYSKGAAYFNGRPLLPDARSTFLFRTFGGS